MGRFRYKVTLKDETNIMSKYTAMARKTPSAPMKWLAENNLLEGRVLDFGSGRGADANTYGLESYDPYWQPDMPTGLFDTITCIYVFNVLEPQQYTSVLKQIGDKLVDGGKLYLAVRRDIKSERKGRGCIQRPVRFPFMSVKKTSNYEIYMLLNDKSET